MTTDAKIGLLLGLVFIFIIAFIINGLPNFQNNANNNELTTNMINSQNTPLGIAAKERRISLEIAPPTKPIKKVQFEPSDDQNIRFTVPLPKSPAVVKEMVTGRTHQAAKASLPVVKKQQIRKPNPAGSKPSLPKFYVVVEGDNLAVIAEKFYGTKEGGKRINVNRIFEANRKLLKSRDEIYIGQKLMIPLLLSLASNKSDAESDFTSAAMFKKVESIGKRHPTKNERLAKQSRKHIVQEGDNLWRIAAKLLGDGNRYREIARLNAAVLDDEDILAIGMCLKIPTR